MNKIVSSAAEKRFQKLEHDLKKLGLKTLRALNKKSNIIEIYLVGKRFMRKNVLAFRATKKFPRPDLRGRFLGEIYLNPDYIKSHNESLEYMFIHGLLHLLGYDHKKVNDRIKMEKKENELLKSVIGKSHTSY